MTGPLDDHTAELLIEAAREQGRAVDAALGALRSYIRGDTDVLYRDDAELVLMAVEELDATVRTLTRIAAATAVSSGVMDQGSAGPVEPAGPSCPGHYDTAGMGSHYCDGSCIAPDAATRRNRTFGTSAGLAFGDTQ